MLKYHVIVVFRIRKQVVGSMDFYPWHDVRGSTRCKCPYLDPRNVILSDTLAIAGGYPFIYFFLCNDLQAHWLVR